MNKQPNLIVMLTHNDKTVENAYEIFEQCKNSKAQYWGFKEEPLPIDQMKKLYAYMKECGKTTFLEVVEYTEEKGLEGAKMAVECGCDILMGTMFFDSINEYCKENFCNVDDGSAGCSDGPSCFCFHHNDCRSGADTGSGGAGGQHRRLKGDCGRHGNRSGCGGRRNRDGHRRRQGGGRYLPPAGYGKQDPHHPHAGSGIY